MRRIILSIALLILFAGVANAKTVYFTEFKGIITGNTYNYIKNGLDKAVEDDAIAYVIKLDTPGGLLGSTRDIVQLIFNSPIPIVVFVSPQGAEAGSAGTFITLAADFAVMTEGSSIGAAHPVTISGGNIEGDMREKAMNSTESFMRSIAEKRNRNVEEALLTVTQSKSFTASEALQAGIIDSIVNNDDSLILMLETELNNGEALTRKDVVPTLTERASFTLSNPNILLILLLLGALMIFLEVKAPGTFVFAGIGIFCIIIFLLGVNIIPINLLGLLIIILGIALMIMELFIASYGLLAVGGIAAVAVGIRLLFDTIGAQGVGVSIGLLIALVAIFCSLFFIIGRMVVKDFFKKPVSGLSSIIGEKGTVMIWEGNKGKVELRGEIWNAISDSKLKAKNTVKVTNVEGLLITVEPAELDK